MSDEALDGLNETVEPAVTEPTKLDQILSDAITKSESANDPPPDDDDSVTDAQRLRDERGRFAKNAVAEAPLDGTAEVATAEVPQDAQPLVEPIEPPARWTDADKAKFAAWPRDVQESVLDRHKAMEADYTRKTQEVAEFRRHAEPLLNVAQQYQPYLAQFGMTAAQALPVLMTAHQNLMTGPIEQRAQALAKLAADAGVDLAAMSRGEVAQVDPLIHQQRQQITALEQRLSSFEQRSLESEQQQLSTQIESFTSAKNTDGTPRYPHFNRVRGVMSQLFASGEAQSLEDAYSKAVAPLNELVAAELASRQKTVEQQQREALEKAKKATPVKSGGTSPNGAAKARGLDALLSEALSSRYA